MVFITLSVIREYVCMLNNGVDLESIDKLVSAVKENAALADVKFSAKSQWEGGTKSSVAVSRFTAGGENIARQDRSFHMCVDEPAELGGKDEAPNPVEYLAAALCGCITAGIATNAALFDTNLEDIQVEVDADISLLGLLGLDRSVPTNLSGISYKVYLKGPDGEEKMLQSKETIDKKSPIANTLKSMVTVTSTGNTIN